MPSTVVLKLKQISIKKYANNELIYVVTGNAIKVCKGNNMSDRKQLLVISKDNQELLLKQDKCDKYDYLIAVGCGVIGGIIDIFLVGTPADSKLLSWTDTQVDKAVTGFAKLTGWNPRAGNENDVSKAILFLQNKYKVNYDQSVSSSASEVLGITPDNHHMKSLGHSPDIVGLFFSILNQFRNTSTFLSDGHLITMNTNTFELTGGNFIAKLFCGVANWFGHLMSDVAGSYTSKGRGAGIVMPFYELFGAFDLGSFSMGDKKGTLADVATKVFEQGYDARFGITQAIPVVITDLSIRLIWSLRRRFQMKKDLRECIPTNVHPDLRVMLLVGTGTLCVMDGIDAGVRSGGNFIAFFMRMNIVAWFKLVKMVLKEVCIRVGVNVELQEYLASFKRINEAIVAYLDELEKIDIDAFKKETAAYNDFCLIMAHTNSEEEMNFVLKTSMKKLGFDLPWEGDFDKFMGDKTNKLLFS